MSIDPELDPFFEDEALEAPKPRSNGSHDANGSGSSTIDGDDEPLSRKGTYKVAVVAGARGFQNITGN